MFNHLRLLPASRGVIACLLAFSLGACATFTHSQTQVRIQQLKDAHLAFIDHHARPAGPPAPWDQAAFDSEVAKIRAQFADAETAESRAVPARKAFIKNSADLFEHDAALIGKRHSLTPSFVASKKKQIEQNYDLILHNL